VDGIRQVLSAELPHLAALAAYRPALGLITGVAAIGAAVALSGLRRRPDLEAKSADDLDVAVCPLAPLCSRKPASLTTAPQ
jgi:hypothetical protein